LRFFAPQGRHVAPTGVKFGMEEPLLHAKFHPRRCNNKGVGPPKLKFLLRLDQNVEYKCPTGAYPLRDFHKICRVCTSFQDALAVKIWLDLLQRLWSYGGFKLRGLVTPKFSAPLAAKLCDDLVYWNLCVRPSIRPQSFYDFDLIGCVGTGETSTTYAHQCDLDPI